jgi:hypothetical protein
VLAAANLLDLLDASPDRVKHCENPDCVLWFFDTTRNGTRRWCSMAVCGNRMKARRHYDRVKARLPVRAILEGSKAGACVIAWFALLCFVVPRGKGLPCRGMARSVRCRVST